MNTADQILVEALDEARRRLRDETLDKAERKALKQTIYALTDHFVRRAAAAPAPALDQDPDGR